MSEFGLLGDRAGAEKVVGGTMLKRLEGSMSGVFSDEMEDVEFELEVTLKTMVLLSKEDEVGLCID